MADSSNKNFYNELKNEPNRIYVIADASLNHAGNKERALALIRAAKWAGADAVKFEIFKEEYRTPARNQGSDEAKSKKTSADLVQKLELPMDTIRALIKEAKRIGIDFISTAFDSETVDFLDELGVNSFVVTAKDLTCRSLIEYVGQKAKPVFLSTCAAATADIEKAVSWIRLHSNDQVVLMHGVSSCPAKPQDLNLRSVQSLRDQFGVPVGFSDDSSQALPSVIATSLGAQVIERHFMIESRTETSEHAVCMDARQLKQHIENLRSIGTSLGQFSQSAPEPQTRNKTFSRPALQARRASAPAKKISAAR